MCFNYKLKKKTFYNRLNEEAFLKIQMSSIKLKMKEIGII